MTILVQEKRPDKTGKMVTRWVKATPSATSTSAPIGAPSVAPAAPTKRVDENKAYIGSLLKNYPRKSQQRETNFARFTYQATPQQLDYCVAVLREHDRFREVFGKLVVDGTAAIDVADIAVMYDPEHFPDSPTEDCANHYGSALMGFRLLGLTGRKQVKDLVVQPEEMQDKARMFMRLDEVLHEEELSGGRTLSRWALMETEHDMDSIVDTIRKHKVSTVREIQGLLGGIIPVLLDGAL